MVTEGLLAGTVDQAGVMGPGQIILILAVVLLIFGGKKIPELMKGLGQGVKEFKDATKSDDEKKEENK